MGLLGGPAGGWDLAVLYSGPDDPRLDRDLSAARRRAEEFRRADPGRPWRRPPSAGDLASLLRTYEGILVLGRRPLAYAFLLQSVEGHDPAARVLHTRVNQTWEKIRALVDWLPVRLAQLNRKTLRGLGAAPECRDYNYFLTGVRGCSRARVPLRRSKPVFKDEASLPGALSGVYDRLLAGLVVRVPAGGRRTGLSLPAAMAYWQSADGRLRRSACRAVYSAIQPLRSCLAHVLYNLAQHQSLEGRRGPLPPLLNSSASCMGVKPRTILQTLDEVCGYYPLVEHFYRLKAQAFGRRRLSQADIYAPWRPGAEPVPYGVAVSCLRRAAADLNPQWGRIVGEVFDQGRIHAVVARGKRPGAFCYCRSPALPPYIALPYSGGLRDVFILAHELGHAVHYRLAAGCSYLNFRSPQVLEETAATLFELLAAHQFIQHEGLGVGLMELLAVRMEGLITTIFRQAALSRFEISLHDTARSQVLDENKINALWRKAMQDLFGQALINDPLQSSGWILVPHFFMRPFTCHNYVLGNLAALSLFRGYLEGGPSYLQEVNRMLAAGGTASPRQLLAEAGVGLGRSGAVRAALGMVAGFLEEFEQVLGLPENVHREG